ncbi:MAG: prolipoprotein diacylglyceryl transferase [Raoultibacter sp.]|jgi:phosphatidylglycerol:prolipoprotein diacylglycerol transferase
MLNDLYQMLDPIAFALGPVEVRWYGLGYVIGFIVGAYLIYSIARRWKIKVDLDALSIIMICVILGVIIGARLGYVLFYGNGYYFTHPLEIFIPVNGGLSGMSFHGGLIGALLSGIVAAKITRIPYLTLVDLGVIAAPIGIFLVRCANFTNGELWGAPTDAAWGVVFGGSAGNEPRHPSQLYEAFLEGLVIFTVLFILSRKLPPRPRGTFAGIFLIMYGIFRFVIEFVREPDSHIGYLWGEWLTMGQVLSTPVIIAGIAILVFAIVKKLPQTGLPEKSNTA